MKFILCSLKTNRLFLSNDIKLKTSLYIIAPNNDKKLIKIYIKIIKNKILINQFQKKKKWI